VSQLLHSSYGGHSIAIGYLHGIDPYLLCDHTYRLDLNHCFIMVLYNNDILTDVVATCFNPGQFGRLEGSVVGVYTSSFTWPQALWRWARCSTYSSPHIIALSHEACPLRQNRVTRRYYPKCQMKKSSEEDMKRTRSMAVHFWGTEVFCSGPNLIWLRYRSRHRYHIINAVVSGY
jgi:hypothetical protein